jgi:hypothetical protein
MEPPTGEDEEGKRTLASVLEALKQRRWKSEEGVFVTGNDAAYLALPLGTSNRAKGARVKMKNIKKKQEDKHSDLCNMLGGEDEDFEYNSLPRVKRQGTAQTCFSYQKLVDRLQAMDEEGLDTNWNGAD